MPPTPDTMNSSATSAWMATVTAKQPDVAGRTQVSIEPSHIDVVARRSPSIVDRLVGLLAQRKQSS